LHQLRVPEIFLDMFETVFKNFAATGAGAAIGKTLALSLLRKDGSEVPVELPLASYCADGVWHAVGTIRDISGRKVAEQEREKSNDLQNCPGGNKVIEHLRKID